MKPILLITIPTLGKRLSSLKFTLSSVEEFAPHAVVEIRTPNVKLESEISDYLSSNVRIVLDNSNQAESILNSWNSNSSVWFTWINDDDFALEGFKSIESIIAKKRNEKKPIVFYGDLVVMSTYKTFLVKTPRRISTWLLSSGSDYVPGVLTVINSSSVEIVTKCSKMDGLLKNSFDYQWWLQLAASKATFTHTGATHAAWRDHPGARTNIESDFSKIETIKLKKQYLNRFFRSRYTTKINSFIAKIVAKTLTLEIW